AWTIRKKLKYCLDSVFNFTELPLLLLTYVGLTGMCVAILVAAAVLVARLIGEISVSCYTPVVLAIMFFRGFSSLGLGIVGRYLWLTLENVRGRPGFVVQSALRFTAAQTRTADRNSP